MTEIPLHDRAGVLVAYAIVDDADARLAALKWHLDTSTGYVRRVERRDGRGGPQRSVYLHREVLGLVPGDGVVADHINRDKLDCRRSNLRAGDRALNQQNRGSNRGSSSQYRGVGWEKETQRWRAFAQVDGVRYKLGRFASEEEAAAVASAFRREHMPFSPDAASV